jgi:hypothetical protein
VGRSSSGNLKLLIKGEPFGAQNQRSSKLGNPAKHPLTFLVRWSANVVSDANHRPKSAALPEASGRVGTCVVQFHLFIAASQFPYPKLKILEYRDSTKFASALLYV